MSAVVVGGALANKPQSGGEAWVRLSWVRGLQRLGFDVWLLEELTPESANPSAVEWFRTTVRRFGLQDNAILLSAGESLAGPPLDRLLDLCSEADLVNISGHVTRPELLRAFRRRVLVDIDPGFTQFWHEQGVGGAHLENHDLYFTIGERIGAPDCPVPTAGIEWLKLRPPVVLDDWPALTPLTLDRFTTIGTWRGGYGPIEHDGHRYGLKVHEFRKFIDLPRRAEPPFELALQIDAGDAADRDALIEHGWRLVDPQAVAADPDSFRAYVQSSGAEFSVAQGVYVGTWCGWFSDRTTRYLASGRPALVQDTGFSETLPTGLGLVAFQTIDEAVAGAADIRARYPEHCEAARRIAEEYFDAERVLARFCEQAGI